MARKNLLTESELRRFMKLAEMRPIGEEKIQEMYGSMPGARDDEEEEMGEQEMDMEMGAEEAPVDELPMGDEPGICLLYTSPSPRDGLLSRMPSSA